MRSLTGPFGLVRTARHVTAAPTGFTHLRWVAAQLEVANLLATRGSQLFPDAPPADLDPVRWAPETHGFDTAPHCLAFAYNKMVTKACGPGVFARMYRDDSIACRCLQQARNGWTPQLLRVAFERDGLIPLQLTRQLQRPRRGCWPVALFCNLRRNEWHLTRMDADGGWSDKPGEHDPRRIFAPGTTDGRRLLMYRNPVDQKRAGFVGFFLVISESLTASVAHPVEPESETASWLETE